MPAKQDAKLREIGRGIFDIEIDAYGDIRTADGFDTPIIVSLFSDARADESEVQDTAKRRGWIGDEGTEDNTGSTLWVYEQARLSQRIANQVEDAARKCIQWLIDDGHAISIRRAELLVSQEAVRFTVEILTEVGEEKRSFILWEASGTNGEFDPITLPPTVPPIPPFVPPPILLGVTQSIDMNGVDEFMASNPATVGVTDRWTFAAWFKIVSNPGTNRTLFEVAHATTGENRFAASLLVGTQQIQMGANSSSATTQRIYEYVLPVSYVIGRWHHFALSHNPAGPSGPELRVYFDGVDYTATVTKPLGDLSYSAQTDTAREMWFGSGRGAAVPRVNCRFHSGALWNEVLAPSEIAAIAAVPDVDLRTATPVPYGKAGNLVHWHVPGLTPGSDAGIRNDHGTLGTHDLADASGLITTADLVSDVPP